MANERIANLLAKGLAEGLIHPGNEATGMPARPIILPLKPSASHPKEMADLLNGTTKLLSEAIVSTIEVEGDSEIVPKSEARSMRKAVGEGPNGPFHVPVHCLCDTGRSDPLVILTMDGSDGPITVDGPSLLRSLAQRRVAHPHDFGPPDPAVIELRTAVLDAMESMTKRQMPTSARKVIADAMEAFLGEGN